MWRVNARPNAIGVFAFCCSRRSARDGRFFAVQQRSLPADRLRVFPPFYCGPIIRSLSPSFEQEKTRARRFPPFLTARSPLLDVCGHAAHTTAAHTAAHIKADAKQRALAIAVLVAVKRSLDLQVETLVVVDHHGSKASRQRRKEGGQVAEKGDRWQEAPQEPQRDLQRLHLPRPQASPSGHRHQLEGDEHHEFVRSGEILNEKSRLQTAK